MKTIKTYYKRTAKEGLIEVVSKNYVLKLIDEIIKNRFLHSRDECLHELKSRIEGKNANRKRRGI